MSNDSTIDPNDRPEENVEPLERDVSGVPDEEIPAVDAHAIDRDTPDSQGDDPVEADLGDEGQGDLAPEDDPAGGASPTRDDGPTDLRTEE
ncbi:hypothetical protein M4I32_10425 [Microbacterium sp. LRZ72]|uniref:hypothetical protein n=1 Tax=Microbacterium sp. LRZ72 TaxID=2942481 RepID=UPI0029AFE129|nr:hypothetical protein [Microbacterium sp. LRZ72]MDX2377214.1 hypothetical protein [Microbacterium sp. LRZ72]